MEQRGEERYGQELIDNINDRQEGAYLSLAYRHVVRDVTLSPTVLNGEFQIINLQSCSSFIYGNVVAVSCSNASSHFMDFLNPSITIYCDETGTAIFELREKS